MKLELKHLAPYLPYGLNVEVFDGIKIMCGLNASAYKDSVDLKYWTTGDDGDGYYSQRPYGIEICKPLLYPLSYLTNDENTYKELYDKCGGIDENLDYICEFSGDLTNTSLSFRAVQILTQKHYDIFGLIEQNLAIDKTTINQ